MSVAQRIRDWRHERQIERLSAAAVAALDAGDRIMARVYWRLMVGAINARSPRQVARMERRFIAGLDESSLRIYEANRVPGGEL